MFKKKGDVLQKVIVDIFCQFSGKMPKVISCDYLTSIGLLDGIGLIGITCIYYAVVDQDSKSTNYIFEIN